MKHYTLEQWIRYAKQEPPLAAVEQLEYEDHLSICDDCLVLYMQGLELVSNTYPEMSDPEAVMNQVLQQLPSIPIEPSSEPPLHKTEGRRKAWLRHPLFHYTVAAAITLILMSTGAFTSVIERLQQGESHAGQAVQRSLEQEDAGGTYTPISRTIMDKTIVMLDALQAKHERGGNR